MTRIISWNVAGFRAAIKKGNLLELLHKESPDILCLQEVKCTLLDIPTIFIKDLDDIDYKLIINSAERKGYSGTGLIIKKSLDPTLIESFPDTEGRIQLYDFHKFILINVYVPNAKPDLSRLKERIEEWEVNIRNLLIKLEEDYKRPIIVTGDLNVAPEEIDIKNFKTNRGKHGFTDEERQAFRDLLKTGKGYIDTFRELHPTEQKYSWFSPMGNARKNNVGWRIDMFITSKRLKNKIETADILSDYTGSDHVPIIFEIKK